jgi:hypothetical protein
MVGKIDGLRSATGRDREEWFALLDAWGAAGRKYREIAGWLMDDQHVSKWWSQKLIVEYEQACRLRPPGIRPDGTFEGSASRTMAVPVAPLRRIRKGTPAKKVAYRREDVPADLAARPLGAFRLGRWVDEGERRLHRQGVSEIHRHGGAHAPIRCQRGRSERKLCGSNDWPSSRRSWRLEAGKG